MPANAIGLLISAVFQAVAGYLIVWLCWPRIRERGGS
jgi:phage shock protein PspC (stress-responsive transcriptional regulator)